jgi:SulP family sulfate permease
LSGVFFAGKVSRMFKVTKSVDADGAHCTYRVEGQIFFASAESFISAFDFTDAGTKKVTIDVQRAHLWDISAVGALDKIVLRYRKAGASVDVVGLNEASSNMIDRFAEHDKEQRVASAAQ